MEWQPIETAPRDGTPVLIYYRSPTTGHLQWSTDGRSREFIRIARWTDRMWRLDAAGHFRNDVLYWMPLPPPPTGEPE